MFLILYVIFVWQLLLSFVRGAWQPTAAENPHGPRSLVGFSPWGRQVWDAAEPLSTALILCTQLICSRLVSELVWALLYDLVTFYHFREINSSVLGLWMESKSKNKKPFKCEYTVVYESIILKTFKNISQ